MLAAARRAGQTQCMNASPSGRWLQNGPDAGDALLDPLVLAALGLLLVNDHVLKATWPGPISGKLSDLAGLAFFPILLVSGAEIVLALGGRWRGPTVRALAVAITLSAAGFILIKTVPWAADGFGWALGLAQWLLWLPIGLLLGQPVPPLSPAMAVADPTDLVALPALALAIWVGAARLRADGLAAPAQTSQATR